MSAVYCHPNDQTGAQLEALLDGMCPMSDDAARMPDYVDGYRLILKMSHQAQGDREIDLKLSREQCAQVLGFLSLVDIEWLQDPPGAPSHAVGFVKLMNVLKYSLRSARPCVGQPRVPRRRKLRLIVDNTRT